MLKLSRWPLFALIIAAINTAAAAAPAAPDCAQAGDLNAARLRWAAARQDRADSPEKACRAYSRYFMEAVTARQATAICGSGEAGQRDLQVLDLEIDAFNDLIAKQCRG